MADVAEEETQPVARPSVVSIGNFDGVHIGHQAIVRRARQIADLHGAAVKVLTFAEHPATVLRPDRVPPRISPRHTQQLLLKAAGVDQIVSLVPEPKLLSLDPQAFLEQVVQTHRPCAIVEGRDFRFGRDRGGDVVLLGDLGQRLGYELEVVNSVEVILTDQWATSVSSSLVRWLVGQGRVADARRCLGRHFQITGRVVEGQRRGRTLGIPTANLDPAPLQGLLLPGAGVYAGLVNIDDGSVRTSAISIGIKPTFDQQELSVEAHLLDFEGDLYGQIVTVIPTRWLRDQQPFPSIQMLRDQLERDVAQTRQIGQQGLLDPSMVPAVSAPVESPA